MIGLCIQCSHDADRAAGPRRRRQLLGTGSGAWSESVGVVWSMDTTSIGQDCADLVPSEEPRWADVGRVSAIGLIWWWAGAAFMLLTTSWSRTSSPAHLQHYGATSADRDITHNPRVPVVRKRWRCEKCSNGSLCLLGCFWQPVDWRLDQAAWLLRQD